MKLTTLLIILLIAPIGCWTLATAANVLLSPMLAQLLFVGFVATGLAAPVVGLGTFLGGVAAWLRGKHKEDYPPLAFLLACLALLSPFWLFFLFAASEAVVSNAAW